MPNRILAALLTGLLPAAAVVLRAQQPPPKPVTPIQHLVIIFPENISFDHYFGTYPHAENPPNEPKFVAAPNTPTINGLTPVLLTRNANAMNPGQWTRCREPLPPRSQSGPHCRSKP